MCVTSGCYGAGVAQDALNMPKAQSVFKQMGGIVAKGVNVDFFNAALRNHRFHSALDAASIHMIVCLLNGFKRAVGIREEPKGMTMLSPECPQCL